jgi:hypothetical protein
MIYYSDIIVYQWLTGLIIVLLHYYALPASVSSCTLCLALFVLLPFMLSAPCPFNAPFLFSVFQLLHTTSFYTPESLSIAAHISSLFNILIASVHLFHAICFLLLHPLHHYCIWVKFRRHVRRNCHFLLSEDRQTLDPLKRRFT